MNKHEKLVIKELNELHDRVERCDNLEQVTNVMLLELITDVKQMLVVMKEEQ